MLLSLVLAASAHPASDASAALQPGDAAAQLIRVAEDDYALPAGLMASVLETAHPRAKSGGSAATMVQADTQETDGALPSDSTILKQLFLGGSARTDDLWKAAKAKIVGEHKAGTLLYEEKIFDFEKARLTKSPASYGGGSVMKFKVVRDVVGKLLHTDWENSDMAEYKNMLDTVPPGALPVERFCADHEVVAAAKATALAHPGAAEFMNTFHDKQLASAVGDHPRFQSAVGCMKALLNTTNMPAYAPAPSSFLDMALAYMPTW
jgi:hypothetical protein